MNATDIIAYTIPGDIFHPRCVPSAGLALAVTDRDGEEFEPVFGSEVNDHASSSCGVCLGPIVDD